MKIRNDECDYYLPSQRRNLISPQWVSPSFNILIFGGKFHILLVFLEEIKHLLKIFVREIRIKAVSNWLLNLE